MLVDSSDWVSFIFLMNSSDLVNFCSLIDLVDLVGSILSVDPRSVVKPDRPGRIFPLSTLLVFVFLKSYSLCRLN
jgi:hypothetical protein